MKKFVITLSVGSRKFWYSIEYFTNGCNRIFSRYFASAHFFDSVESAMSEFNQMSLEDRSSLLNQLKTTHGFTSAEFYTYKITIQQIHLSDVMELDNVQSSMVRWIELLETKIAT